LSLPTEATGLTGQTTTDAGPIHAASSVDFDLGDGIVITVGRRVSSGVVIFVEADGQDLQRCLTASCTTHRVISRTESAARGSEPGRAAV
jgi:hypothetical protein